MYQGDLTARLSTGPFNARQSPAPLKPLLHENLYPKNLHPNVDETRFPSIRGRVTTEQLASSYVTGYIATYRHTAYGVLLFE